MVEVQREERTETAATRLFDRLYDASVRVSKSGTGDRAITSMTRSIYGAVDERNQLRTVVKMEVNYVKNFRCLEDMKYRKISRKCCSDNMIASYLVEGRFMVCGACRGNYVVKGLLLHTSVYTHSRG